MKKYILIIIVGISVLLGAILLQAGAIYSPRKVAVRVRDSKLDVTWEHHPDNPSVSCYRVYYCTTTSKWPSYDYVQEVEGIYRWATLSGLTNGDTCYIKVAAIDDGVGSDTSTAECERIATPAPADTTVTRSISGGTTAAAYTMVSTPVESEDTRISAVIGDDLGPYDNTQWRCFHWESESGVYEEGTLSNNDFGPSQGQPLVGEAAWLISRNDVTIDVTGCVYDYDNTRNYEIYLQPGWNQIGCPFNFDVAWSDVEVTDGTDTYPVEDPNNDLCGSTAWTWCNGTYYAVTILAPMRGCFVYNKTNGDIGLIVPHSEVRGLRGEDYNIGRSPSYREGEPEESPPAPPAGFISADLSSGGGGGCFIATAAYGTEMAKEVMLLQKFRDEVLLKSPAGREFVKLYYTFSPPIADFIKDKLALKAIVRVNLKPLIWLSRKVTK